MSELQRTQKYFNKNPVYSKVGKTLQKEFDREEVKEFNGQPITYYSLDVDQVYDGFSQFFSKRVISHISKRLTYLLQGVHPENKRIVVSDENIFFTMQSIYNNNRDNVWRMIDTVIETIYTHVKDEFEINEVNQRLNIWITKYDETEYQGEGTGIRRYAPIKTNEKTRARMFVMNY
jgi:hypothetical protein